MDTRRVRRQPVSRLDINAAVRRAEGLATSSARKVVGITGPPGAGKSRLANLVADKVSAAVVVGMDAFHLAQSTLTEFGLAERKGAPETFDASGYVALLRRIRSVEVDPVWAPKFYREVENAIAGVVGIRSDTCLVVTEGNYLLLDEQPWRQVRELTDEIWYVDAPEHLRHERLAARHQEFGRTSDEAWERTLGVDEQNAKLVHASRHHADILVTTD